MPEPAQLPRPARLGDHPLPHRQRPERARLQLRPAGRPGTRAPRPAPRRRRPSGRRRPACSRPGVARDPLPRHHQRRRVIDEVEQVIEPAARIGHRPTVQLGLHLRTRRHGPTGPGRGAPVFTGASSGITASFPSRNRCRPSPCDRLSPARSTTAAPPHPGPIGRRCAQPDPPRWLRRRRARPGRFPCSLLIRSTKEEPDSAPAASPRLRRRHFTVASRPADPYPPGSSPPATKHGGYAPLPAHIHQVRAGDALRGVTTPVPRVLLSVSLAGPAPSGSAGTSRLCQGCSHPPRHLPDQAAPSFTALLRQARR